MAEYIYTYMRCVEIVGVLECARRAECHIPESLENVLIIDANVRRRPQCIQSVKVIYLHEFIAPTTSHISKTQRDFSVLYGVAR